MLKKPNIIIIDDIAENLDESLSEVKKNKSNTLYRNISKNKKTIKKQ